MIDKKVEEFLNKVASNLYTDYLMIEKFFNKNYPLIQNNEKLLKIISGFDTERIEGYGRFKLNHNITCYALIPIFDAMNKLNINSQQTIINEYSNIIEKFLQKDIKSDSLFLISNFQNFRLEENKITFLNSYLSLSDENSKIFSDAKRHRMAKSPNNLEKIINIFINENDIDAIKKFMRLEPKKLTAINDSKESVLILSPFNSDFFVYNGPDKQSIIGGINSNLYQDFKNEVLEKLSEFAPELELFPPKDIEAVKTTCLLEKQTSKS